jgi:hypothetical protein
MTALDPRPPLSRLVYLVAGATALLLLSTAGRYGIFRDEYYYLMCAAHPAWGYVDHPPLAMIFLALWDAAFGASVVALRVPPALLCGAAAWGAALLAREMRGGSASQVVAAVAVGLMPGCLALGSFYSMNAFDVVFWILALWIACRLVDPAGNRRWWWGLGLAVGFGLLNKYSMLFLAAGLGVGILLSPLRRELLTRNRLVGSLIVFLILLPHLVWQVQHGWPTAEFIRNAHDLKNVAMSPTGFWGEQMLLTHPGFTPVWVTGLVGLLFAPRLRRWRPLGVAFVVVAVWLTFSSAKPYYMIPAYPTLMAAGAVLIIDWLRRWRRLSRVVGVGLPILLVMEGMVIAPLAIPILAPAAYISYEQALGLRPKNTEHNVVGALPQHFADRFGWEGLAQTVQDVIAALPDAERQHVLVVTGNYGECGAINYWGLPEGVRPAVSGHNSCNYWWPADFVPEVVVFVGVPRERALHWFHRVELGGTHRSEWAMPFESELPIWIGREWKGDPAAAREEARLAI